jgi:hypothetical protein
MAATLRSLGGALRGAHQGLGELLRAECRGLDEAIGGNQWHHNERKKTFSSAASKQLRARRPQYANEVVDRVAEVRPSHNITLRWDSNITRAQP